MPDVSWGRVTEWPSRGDDRSAHASLARQRGQPVRGMPHAEDRTDHRECERPQPQLQVHHAVYDRRVQDSQSVRFLSYDANERLGAAAAEKLDRGVARSEEHTSELQSL